jgi:two-component system sensor histidine kinase BarA
MNPRRLSLSSIRAQIIIGGLLPLLLVASVFGVLVGSLGLQDKRESIESEVELVADSLAQFSEYYLFSGDQVILQRMVMDAVNSKWVGSAVIVNQGYELMAAVGAESLSTTDVSSYVDRWQRADRTRSLLGNNTNLGFFALEGELFFVREIGGSGLDVSDGLYADSQFEAAPASDTLGWLVVGMDIARVNSANAQVIARSLWVFFIGAVFSLIVSLYLSRRLLKPINAVTKTIYHIADGDFSARVRASGKGETVRLIANVNTMAEIVESSQRQLQHRVDEATESLQQKVEELEQKNAELDVARNKANEAGRVKANFLANMSHEIRTPVNAIYGFSQRILKPGSAKETQEYVEMMSRAASLLIHLIDGILEFSKAESGAIKLNESIFDVRLCLENIATIFSTEAQEKGLELVTLIENDVPEFIKGDELRIEQVLANLLANAIKFTAEGHVILRASVDEDHQHLKISVIDTGIGIASDEITTLFKAFQQSDSTPSRHYGGVGLGLSICRHITTLMGEGVVVTSQLGEGSEFYFRLPIHTPIEPDVPGDMSLAKYNVLVFEPHAMARHSLRNSLVMNGLTVYSAQHTRAARRILTNQLPGNKAIGAVIIGLSPRSDKVEDNRERIRAVRAIFSGPILLLATSRQSETELLSDTQGKVSVLVKPAGLTRVMVRLGELLEFDREMPIDEPFRGFGSRCLSSFPSRFLSGHRVLVAEDNEFNRRLIESWLLDWGAEVVLARDGQEAVDRTIKQNVDLVLLDLHMPNLDGISALNKLRALDDSRFNSLPVIIVTADVFGAKEHLEEPVASVEMIYKPINSELLAQTMANMLGLSYVGDVGAQHGSSSAHAAVPERLRQKLGKELARLDRALRDALEAGDNEALSDLLHQLHGIAGYFQLESLECAVGACRDGFNKNGPRPSEAETKELLGLLSQFVGETTEGFK